ncbi:MAG: amidohydrolase family protein [Planctomycetes bacterium]|nr:amidohydrolase family protein [Planctomycetota bacterium]
MPNRFWIVFLLVISAWALIDQKSSAGVRDKIALKAGKVIPVAGEPFGPGVVLISGGKIEALGEEIEIPYDYWVVEATDEVIFPGMVEPFTSRGLDRTNESLPITPFLDVADAIDPSSIFFEDALRDGITTLLISQGSDTVIGGLARVVRPIGMSVDEMTLKPRAGMILAFGPKSGNDRMVQMAAFREAFRDLEEYLRDLGEQRYETVEKEAGRAIKVGPDEAARLGRDLIREEDLDFKHQNLFHLTQGRLRAFLYCNNALDVVHALETAKTHGFLQRAVLVLESGCYKALDLIKASGRPVILDPDMIFRKTDPLTGEEEEIFVPKLYCDAGIPFALRSDPQQSFGARYPWYQAARLVRNGIPRRTALEAITTMPAAFVGMGSRMGALLPGLDANLLVLSGDPLDMETWVKKVFIQGTLVYEQEKDYRLKELLSGEEIGPNDAGDAPSPPREESSSEEGNRTPDHSQDGE